MSVADSPTIHHKPMSHVSMQNLFNSMSQPMPPVGSLGARLCPAEEVQLVQKCLNTAHNEGLSAPRAVKEGEWCLAASRRVARTGHVACRHAPELAMEFIRGLVKSVQQLNCHSDVQK